MHVEIGVFKVEDTPVAHGLSSREAPALQEVARSHLRRDTSLIRNNPPVGPYSSPMPRDLW